VVSIVQLSDKPDGSKQGVDDFLAAGGTVEELLDLSNEDLRLGYCDPEWPTLGDEAYHGPAGKVVRQIEPNTESDPAGLLSIFLAAFGNAIGRGAHFMVEDDFHYLKINPVLVGDSSKARKGTGQNRINRLMKRVDSDWYERCVTTGLSSGEGVIHRVRDRVERETEDGTMAVVDPGVEDKRLFVEEPEFASPLTVMRREGNTLSMVVRNAYDERVLQTLTKTSSETSSGSHVTIVGHITKRELLRHLTEEKLGGGIANRFAFVLVRRSKSLPFGGKEDAFEEELVDRLRRALDFGKIHQRIELSDDVEEDYGYSAVDLWLEIYEDLSEGKPGLFGAVVSRAEAQVRRIATVYAVLDESERVRVAHLLAALAVWQYAEESAYLIFEDRTGDPVANDILETLKDKCEEGMSTTDIHALFSRNYKAQRIRAALRDLEAQKRIRREKVKPESGAGRPTEMWFILDE
jgi:hypothetical protein